MPTATTAARAQRAYQILRQLGLSEGAATGVVGNLIGESALNTAAVGDGGKARGIAQWHPDRYAGMVNWAMRNGLNPNAMDTQVKYVAVEAKTGVGGNVWGDLLKSDSAVEASALFMRRFERPADQSDAAAKRRAQAGIDALGGKTALGTIGDVLGGVTDLIPGVSEAKDVGGAMVWIAQPHNMIRVVYVVGGGAMMIVGLSIIARPVTGPIATAVATRGMSLAK